MKNPHDELSLLQDGTTRYPDSPDEAQLETFTNAYAGREYVIRFDCPEFTSLCPITGQPDFATIHVDYVPDKKVVESKSFKLYLWSYRNEGSFHEHVVNQILDDLQEILDAHWIRVSGVFNIRGGIDISVEAEHTRTIEARNQWKDRPTSIQGEIG